MSVKAMNAVFEHSESRLGARLVMLAIADNADDHGIAWPGIKTLANKAKVSSRAVQYAIEELAGLGELVIYLRKSPYGTNLYVIRLPGILPVQLGETQILRHLKTSRS
jgi:hypothetical protein